MVDPNSWNLSAPAAIEDDDHDVIPVGQHLNGKIIALLITGSIAAMRAPMLIRDLRRQGAKVQVFASPEALRYTTIDALSWSSNMPVITQLSVQSEHLAGQRNYAAYLVAPATYNTINKIATGIADGALTTTLASALGKMAQGKTCVLIAPAMHGSMHNVILERSMRTLLQLGVSIIPPKQAQGKNLLADNHSLVSAVCRAVSSSPLKQVPLLVTSGNTPVYIDNVRYISNHFTGRLGGLIAETLFLRGANVLLIQGRGTYQLQYEIPQIAIHTYDEYRQQVLAACADHAPKFGIFSAAVADYKPAQVVAGKISSGDASRTLSLLPTAKVIDEVKLTFPQLRLLSFKYMVNVTHQALLAEAKDRLERGHTAVIANSSDENDVNDNNQQHIAHLVCANHAPQRLVGKITIATAIADFLEEHIAGDHSDEN